MGLRPLPVGSPGALGLTVRLLLPSLRLRVSESSSLSAWSFPFRGLSLFLVFVPLLETLSESLTHSIPRSFLVVALSASVVGFADALWLCPERALRCFLCIGIIVRSRSIVAPPLHRVFTDGFRHWCAFRFCGGGGGGGGVWSRRDPWGGGGLWWLHLYRLTPDLIGLRHFAVCHWSSGRCFLFYCATIPHSIHGDHLVSFTDSCVSLARHSHRGIFLGHLQGE